jgi:hypothetical protein
VADVTEEDILGGRVGGRRLWLQQEEEQEQEQRRGGDDAEAHAGTSAGMSGTGVLRQGERQQDSNSAAHRLVVHHGAEYLPVVVTLQHNLVALVVLW